MISNRKFCLTFFSNEFRFKFILRVNDTIPAVWPEEGVNKTEIQSTYALWSVLNALIGSCEYPQSIGRNFIKYDCLDYNNDGIISQGTDSKVMNIRSVQIGRSNWIVGRILTAKMNGPSKWSSELETAHESPKVNTIKSGKFWFEWDQSSLEQDQKSPMMYEEFLKNMISITESCQI